MSHSSENKIDPTAAVAHFSRSYQRLGRVNLKVLDGPDRGKEFHVDLSDRRLITAGRDAANDIVLSDTHISGNHFQIGVTPRGLSGFRTGPWERWYRPARYPTTRGGA